LISDLERVCDYLVLLMASEVRLAGPIEQLVAEHKVLTGPRDTDPHLPGVAEIVLAEHAARQTTLIARMAGPVHHPEWTVEDIGLEELVLAHMGAPSAPPDHDGSVVQIDRAKVHA
jgi:ABC-2 type transport system ATP-binding protein